MVKEIKTINDVTIDPHNTSRATQRGMKMLEESFQECGAGRSMLVDKNGRAIAGSKSLETAKGIGMEDVIVVQSDGTKPVIVQRTDLDMDTDEIALRLAIYDNRTQQLSNWDFKELQALRDRGVSMSGLFSEEEFENLSKLREEFTADEGTDSNNEEDTTDNETKPPVFMVLIECDGLVSQEELMERLKGEGYTVHAYNNEEKDSATKYKKGRHR